jgi:hypothetical protein
MINAVLLLVGIFVGAHEKSHTLANSTVSTTASPTTATPFVNCSALHNDTLCTTARTNSQCYFCYSADPNNTAGGDCIPAAQTCPFCNLLVTQYNLTCQSAATADCTMCYSSGECVSAGYSGCTACRDYGQAACTANQNNASVPGPRCQWCDLTGGSCVNGGNCRCASFTNEAYCMAHPDCQYCSFANSCQNKSRACATCESMGSAAVTCSLYADCGFCATTQSCYTLNTNYTCPTCKQVSNKSQCTAAFSFYTLQVCQWCVSTVAGISDMCYPSPLMCPNQPIPTIPNLYPIDASDDFWNVRNTSTIVVTCIAASMACASLRWYIVARRRRSRLLSGGANSGAIQQAQTPLNAQVVVGTVVNPVSRNASGTN